MKKRPQRKGLHLYFIPHAHNDYHPHVLGLVSVVVITAAIAAMPYVVDYAVTTTLEVRDQSAAVLAASLYQLANTDRDHNGKSNLAYSEVLSYAAQLKAEDMAQRQYFSHNDPNGKEPWIWFDKVGYAYDHAGENLAIDFHESRDVQVAWMNSEKHRENILKKDYTEIGIGTAQGIYQGHLTTYVVQFFGKPKIVVIAVNEKKAVVQQKKVVKEIVSDPEVVSTSEVQNAGASTTELIALNGEVATSDGAVLGTGTEIVAQVDTTEPVKTEPIKQVTPPRSATADFLGGWMAYLALLLGSPSYVLMGLYTLLLALFVLMGFHLFGKHHLFVRREAYVGMALLIVVTATLLWYAYVPGSVVLA